MKIKKRDKRSRLRGARTCGYGFRQKHKGHGNGGGFGMAGTGKRADHMKQRALEMAKAAGFKSYFGKQGFTSARGEKRKVDQINLIDVKKNILKKSGEKIDLSKHKILGKGDGFKAEIIARAASKMAIEKMEKAGGKIIVKNSLVKKKKLKKKKKLLKKKQNLRKLQK